MDWYSHYFFKYNSLIVPERQRAHTLIEETLETEQHWKNETAAGLGREESKCYSLYLN